MKQLANHDQVKNKYQELKEQFLEMAQLKSDFDIEKFTVMSKGNFIAHQFHFLMRQYSLALYELRRLYLDIEEKNRKINEYKDLIRSGSNKINIDNQEKYLDIEVERCKNEIDLLEISLKNKWEICSYFEQCRIELIKRNDNKSITNDQYQEEEPEYWKWYLNRIAITQVRERQTGIKEGIWMNIDHLEHPSVINPEFQINMLDSKGILNLGQASIDNEKMKGLINRVDNLKGGLEE